MDAADFTRNRSLPLPHFVAMLLNLRKGGIGDELGRFFDVPHDQPLADGVTPSALCQARETPNRDALIGLGEPLLAGDVCQDSCRVFYAAMPLIPSTSASGFSGFSQTVPTGAQLRISPLQRWGCAPAPR